MKYHLKINYATSVDNGYCHDYEIDSAGLHFRRVVDEGEPVQYVFVPSHAFESLIATQVLEE